MELVTSLFFFWQLDFSNNEQGHVKIRTTSLQDATKRHGADTAEHLAAFVNDHIYAIKDVVEREGIDCEFELRRSFDVFLDAEEAQIAKEGFQEALKERRSWTRERNLVDGPNLEQVGLRAEFLTTLSNTDSVHR